MAVGTTTARSRAGRARRWRRASQAAFLLLFLYLLLWTRQPAPQLAKHALFFRLDPLTGLATMLAARRWIGGVALGLVTILLALLTGRSWCGWVCPLGTLLDLFTFRRARAHSRDLPAPWRSVKYGLLTLIVVGALAGSLTLLVLDPLTLLARALTAAVLPISDALLEGAARTLYGVAPLRGAVSTVDAFIRRTVLPAQPALVTANLALAALLLLVLATSAIRTRFWCRYLCPLGGLLALCARVSVVRQRVDAASCIHCGRCARACPTGAIIAEHGYVADVTECTACQECVAICPTGAISFGQRPSATGVWPYDPSRRQLLLSLGIAALGAALLRGARTLAAPSRWLLRPPGAGEETLLAQCIRCGQCVKVCPTGALQPGLVTTGPEALWTPVLTPRQGYCDYGCSACGEACPTGAIPPLELAQKREMVLGVAVVDRTRCLAWARQQVCIVCEEMCPVPNKAILLDDIEIATPQSGTFLLRRPVVNEQRCIGCGSCEFHCPVEGPAAIQVQRAEVAGTIAHRQAVGSHGAL